MAPDGRMEREGSIILTPSAFDGRMRRRRRRRAIGSAPPTSSVGYFRGGGAASSAEVDRRRNDKTTATAPPAPNDDDDALPILMRVALGAVVQTCLSYAIASNLFALGNLTRASALLFVVYGSSYLGFIVEMMGSKSAAIRQVLDPGRVPVSHELSGGDILVFFFFRHSRLCSSCDVYSSRYRIIRVFVEPNVTSLRTSILSCDDFRSGIPSKDDGDWYAGLKKPRWNPP
jgi:hypothetical protein